ncbi:MAG: hypothetical protein RL622_864, partial [Actinomycetota bacterium]
SIPPAACFAPTVKYVMDAKTFSTVGELDWGRPVGAHW